MAPLEKLAKSQLPKWQPSEPSRLKGGKDRHVPNVCCSVR